jgi:hypothetical protein
VKTARTNLIFLAILCLSLFLGLGLFLRGRRAKNGASIAASGGAALALSCDAPYFLQNDPLWATEPIGGSNEPMASVGCTVTSVAMGLASLGQPINPQKLCRSLKSNNGFTDSGFLVWGTIAKATNHKIRIEIPALSHRSIDRELQQHRPVVTKILLNESIAHWVLIVGKKDKEYLIHDPLSAEKRVLKLSERSSRIYAIRVFRLI